MPRFSRPSWPALPVWVAAVAVAALPTWWPRRERPALEEPASTASGNVYELVCRYSGGGTTLSPLAPLRRDLEAVMEVTTGWAFPALLVLLGLLTCLGRGERGVTGRRVAGLLVLVAAVEPLASSYSYKKGCDEILPFGADWFAGAAGGWGITQVCLPVAAALVVAASRTMRSVAGDEANRPDALNTPDEPNRLNTPDEPNRLDAPDAPNRPGEREEPGEPGRPDGSQAGMAWRRPSAALVDYLIVVTAVNAVVWAALLLTGVSLEVHMGAGLLERADAYLFRGDVRPADVAVLAGVFLFFWAQHALWGRTPGKWLLGVRVVDARTGGRLGAGRAALRTLAFPFLAFVPGVGMWCLLASGTWMICDPRGRVLHDRLLGAAVVRDRGRSARPRTGPAPVVRGRIPSP